MTSDAFGSNVTALLGPTNTGKTHRAIERMLEHGTGMIGLPLRLLAREVYDKVSARIGESRVALVTGEEQRVPPRPAYVIATVEAMPISRDVEFVAVDEIQLAAHEQRGHVFTSRLLSARGTKETWFLGADTMRPILGALVPAARVVDHPRLSRLGFAGATPLSKVPPRSAIVAFSMPHVYEIAEKLRAKKGGAAVVLGALSPRTRNAQVAMFQAGEVDWLVATDAIGMGLNLDVSHVAFAATRKFDGRDVRDVDEAELAQIAGRAGRWVQDGTFGTIAPLTLPLDVVSAIEEHRFGAVRRVRWRNDDLAFDSIDDLRASLHIRPKRKMLSAAFEADDAKALGMLADRESVRRAVRNETSVRLLWEVCSIPDFPKMLFEAHVDLLEEIWIELVTHGKLRGDWIARRVRAIGGIEGDVEDLVARLATIRTWTYVANRDGWLDDPEAWQEETRALEDRLSDALHERLVMRFVEVKKTTRPAHPSRPRSAPVLEDDRPSAKGHPFAALAAMRDAMIGLERSSSPTLLGSWVDAIVDAPHDAFDLDERGIITHTPTKRIVGAILGGSSIALPGVRLIDVDDLGAGAKSRLQRRLLAFGRDVVDALLGSLADLARSEAASLRGLVHRLEHGLGTVRTREIADLLDDSVRTALASAGVEVGGCVTWLPRGLEPRSIAARVALGSVFHRVAMKAPRRGAVSITRARGFDRELYAAIGHPVFGPRAIRADVAERVFRADGVPAATLSTWIGCTARELPRILDAMRGEDMPDSDGAIEP